MLNASADFRLFFGIYYDRNDGNIYIEYHMDFLPKTAHLQGGDTREERNIRDLAYHVKPSKSVRWQDPPPRQPLKIHQITTFPLNPF